MSLISLVIALILIGAVLYIANLLPTDGTVKRIIQVVLIVALVIWLLQHFAPALRF